MRRLIEEQRPGVPLAEISRSIGPRVNEVRAFDEAARQEKLPDARSLAGLAKALDVAVLDVLVAAASDAGLDVQLDLEPDQRRLLHLAGRVPASQRPAIIELLSNVLRFAEAVTVSPDAPSQNGKPRRTKKGTHQE